jgi:hypothetical protein
LQVSGVLPLQRFAAGTQPQTFGVVAPQMKLGPAAEQSASHDTLWRQLSVTVPHRPAQVVSLASGTQHVLGAASPTPHSDVGLQVTPPFAAEQVTLWPQLFVTAPHLLAHVLLVSSGVQPQWLASPPPPQAPRPISAQWSPHWTDAPQLSVTAPHLPSQVLAASSGTHALHAPPEQP